MSGEDYEPEPQPHEQWVAENPNDPEVISYIKDEALRIEREEKEKEKEKEEKEKIYQEKISIKCCLLHNSSRF